MVSGGDIAVRQACRHNHCHRWALFCIAMLGLALRLYRLDEQSVWFDEMNTLVNNPAATLTTYLADVREVNPDHVPVYFLLVFGLTKYLGLAPLGLRIVSVLLGTLAIPLLYLFARQNLDRRAGLAAAFCLAISPLHIYLHQAIRCYALLDVLVLLSLLLTLRAARSPRVGWLTLHAGICLLMVFTHLSTALLVMIECVYIPGVLLAPQLRAGRAAVLRGLLRRDLFLWASLHAVIALQCILWFRSVEARGVTWYELPGGMSFLNQLLGSVVIHWNVDFMTTPIIFDLPQTAPHGWLLAANIATLVLFGAGLAWGIGQAVKRARNDAFGPTLLAAIALLPVLLLAALSLAWHPVLLPRYTMFSTLAVFVIAGAFFTRARRPALRTMSLLALAAVFATQLSLFLPCLARSDFLGAARVLRDARAEGESLTAIYLTPDGRLSIPNTAAIVRKNLDGYPIRVNPAYSLAGAVVQGISCMAPTPAVPHPRTWMLIEHWTGFPERATIEYALQQAGIAYTHWESTNLQLYSFQGNGAEHTPEVVEALLTGISPDRTKLAQVLIGEAPSQANDTVLDAIEWAVPSLPLKHDEMPLFFEATRAMQINPRAGRLIDEYASREREDYYLDHLISGLSYLAEGDHENARRCFHRADAGVIEQMETVVPGIEDLTRGNYAGARAKVAETNARFPARVPAFFRYLLGVTPPPCGSMIKPLF